MESLDGHHREIAPRPGRLRNHGRNERQDDLENLLALSHLPRALPRNAALRPDALRTLLLPAHVAKRRYGSRAFLELRRSAGHRRHSFLPGHAGGRFLDDQEARISPHLLRHPLVFRRLRANINLRSLRNGKRSPHVFPLRGLDAQCRLGAGAARLQMDRKIPGKAPDDYSQRASRNRPGASRLRPRHRAAQSRLAATNPRSSTT